MKKISLIASLSVGLLALAGCSGGAGDEAAGAEGIGVDYGADKAAWAKAFADVDPIELRTQSSAGKDAESGADWQAFLDSITEYSDGKITFDVGYSNAYAEATEADNALVDGRLDLAQVITQYEPEEFPVSNQLVASTVNSNFSPVNGTVASNIWPNQVGFESQDVVAEFEDKDMHLLLPYYNTGAGSLFCNAPTTTADQVNGAVVGASGAEQTKQLKSIGASPTSLAFTEFYESLQRGAIDCVQTTPGAAVVSGITEVAPHAVIDPEHAFIAGSSSVATSQAMWEDLPLQAQQLISDKMLTFMYENIAKNWGNLTAFSEQAGAAGGEVSAFDESVVPVLEKSDQKINDDLAANGGEAIASAAQDSSASWLEKVEGEDFKAVDSYDELAEWSTDENKASVKKYIDSTVAEEIFSSQRPS